ncbi:MAG: DUF2851 family protein [Calditrichaeota bacterium]|nr:MAG: DUF2851 family protein [Calditrichota bacterium]
MVKPRFSEFQLHEFWEKSRYFSRPLLTQNGNQVEIIRRGRPNQDGGPDFRNIVIRMNDAILEGDCELHLNSIDWKRHGHHLDRAYNQTCLHVALDNVPVTRIHLENGCEVEQILVPSELLAEFIAKKEADDKDVQATKCALGSCDASKKMSILHNAGMERLVQKAAVFKERFHAVSWDQLVYEGLCQALGYSKNTQAFQMLAQIIPIDLLFYEMRQARSGLAEATTAALLFGAAGFLDEKSLKDNNSTEIQAYTATLRDIWCHAQHVLQIRPMQRAQWQFFRLRPQNFPTRRIAGIVKLITKFERVGVLERLTSNILNEGLTHAEINISLRDYFAIEADAFWQQHYDFKVRESKTSNKSFGMLIGKNRADDLVVNIVLPILLLYASETGDANLNNKLQELFSDYPCLQENSVTRKMRNRLFLHRNQKNELQYTARLQQGLIHLSKNFCLDGDCNKCLQTKLLSATREADN